MVTLSALVSGLDAELVRLGYKASTMVWYRGCWRRLERFFAARGVEEFSLDLAMAWVDEACGFFDKEQAGTLKPTDVYLFRVAQMLGDYAVHGAVLRRYSRSVSRLAGGGPTPSPDSRRGCGPPTGPRRPCGPTATVAGEFVAFRTPAAGWLAVTPGRSRRSSPRWPATSSRPSSRNCARCGRSCRFAVGDGLVDAAVLDAVPAVTSPQADQDPVGVGSGRGDQDPGRDRPGQPVREAGLRDHPADHQARAARHRHQTAGVRRFRLAGQPAVASVRPRPVTGCGCRC